MGKLMSKNREVTGLGRRVTGDGQGSARGWVSRKGVLVIGGNNGGGRGQVTGLGFPVDGQGFCLGLGLGQVGDWANLGFWFG